jgi:elongator complex protein 3
VDVVADAWRWIPEWCRVQRVDRDIPTTHVEAGVAHSNLRELAEAEAVRRGHPPRDIRAREVHRRRAEGRDVAADRLVLVRRDYDASGGTEAFLAWEDPVADAIVAFVRVRRVSPGAHRAELQHPRGAAVVRELKVYGDALALGDHDDPERGAWQHQGLGARLLVEAERLAFVEWRVGRLAVTAGVGVKQYYRRHGFTDLGAYVVKEP